MKKNETVIGLNRTGIEMSPIDSQKLQGAVLASAPAVDGDYSKVHALKSSYFQDADGVGSVSLPTTPKGILASTLKKMVGKKPEVLIDLLGERLAFERSGTRLYDALLEKIKLDKDLPKLFNHEVVALLSQFRDEEHQHFLLIQDAMKEIGADPTSVTPSADMAGVASQGWGQVLSDPRSSFSHCIETILMAELADYDSWKLLIQMVGEMGWEQLQLSFKKAYEEEKIHLEKMRQIYGQLTLSRIHSIG